MDPGCLLQCWSTPASICSSPFLQGVSGWWVTSSWCLHWAGRAMQAAPFRELWPLLRLAGSSPWLRASPQFLQLQSLIWGLKHCWSNCWNGAFHMLHGACHGGSPGWWLEFLSAVTKYPFYYIKCVVEMPVRNWNIFPDVPKDLWCAMPVCSLVPVLFSCSQQEGLAGQPVSGHIALRAVEYVLLAGLLRVDGLYLWAILCSYEMKCFSCFFGTC